MFLRLVALLLLAFPLVEIAGFVIVGGWLGVLGTLAAIVASALFGIVIVRFQGIGMLQRIRAEMDAGRVPGRELAHGAMIVVAGLLLIIPGFVSDAIGVVLLVPPLRDLIWRAVARHVTIVSHSGVRHPDGSGAARASDAPRTIDLEPGEYGEYGRSDSPWRNP